MREGEEEYVKVNPNFFLNALQWDKPRFYYHKIFNNISVIAIVLWGQFKEVKLFSMPLLASAKFEKGKKKDIGRNSLAGLLRTWAIQIIPVKPF